VLFPQLRRERRLDGKSPPPVPVAEEAPLDRAPGP
jgi:hypothetical protein